MDKTTAKQFENDSGEAYFNGFQVAVGSGNVAVNLFRDDQPFMTLHASCATAKMLSEVLGSALNGVEEKTGTSSKNPPPGFFRSAYEDPAPEKLALEEAMGQVEQTVEK